MAPHPLSNSAHFPLPLSYTTEGKLRLNDWRQIPRLRWYSEGLDSPSTQAPGALGGPGSPLPEFLEEDAVGEALAADADTLEDPVTAELVQHQAWLQFPSLQGQWWPPGAPQSGPWKCSPSPASHWGILGWSFTTYEPRAQSSFYILFETRC